MKLKNILVEDNDDYENEAQDFKRNRELSVKFVKMIKEITRGQVDMKGEDADDMTEEFLFWEPGGRNFGFWCAYGILKNFGYDCDEDQTDNDKFIEAMKELGFTRGECAHIIAQREK